MFRFFTYKLGASQALLLLLQAYDVSPRFLLELFTARRD